MEIYAAMVDRMDQGVGRVMAALKECGVDERTLVIFLSDNGGCGSASSAAAARAFREGKAPGGKDSYILCGPGWATAQSSPFRRFKTWTYEGGISTPAIVRWPGRVKPNAITTAVGHVVDLMPTFLGISGATYPERFGGKEILPMEGVSLKSILLDSGAPLERELGWYLYGSRAYRGQVEDRLGRHRQALGTLRHGGRPNGDSRPRHGSSGDRPQTHRGVENVGAAERGTSVIPPWGAKGESAFPLTPPPAPRRACDSRG